LTRILREKVHKTVASLLAKILLKKKLLKAREFGGLNGLDLAKECCDPEALNGLKVHGIR
jgi:carbamoyl-phosphate synthase small subunit